MTILLIAWNFPPKTGGLENVLYHLWRTLRRTHTVYVIAPAARLEAPDEEGLIRCPFASLPLFLVYSFFAACSLHRRANIDVVFAGSGVVALTAALAAGAMRRRSVVHVFGLDVIFPNFFYQRMLAAGLGASDTVVSISYATHKHLLARGVPPQKIRVVYPGIDTSLFRRELSAPAMKERHGLGGRLVILTTCRLARRKGVLEFIDGVLPQVAAACPGVVYAVVGTHPRQALFHKEQLKEKMEDAVAARGLRDHVRFFGAVTADALIELYYACDLFVLPVLALKNDMEGFGLVLLEANAAGKAVVATAVGGIPEAVEDGKSGILVSPGDNAAMARAISELLADPGRREALGAYGRRRVFERFDWERSGGEYASVLEEVMHKDARR